MDARNHEPAVTVLMSVYNGETFLREAIESILQQTWTDFEFLIVDDGSTDQTREILQSYNDERIRVLDQPTNIGLAKSLNFGLREARAPLVARQDADDRSRPERLAAQVQFMSAHREVTLAGTQVRILDKHGRALRWPGWERATTNHAIRFQLLLDNPFIHTSVMFRRDVVWQEFGGYDETLSTGQDFDLWSRVAARYKVSNLPAILIDYRFHGSSASARYDQNHLERSSSIVAANLHRYLGHERVPESWGRLISSLHVDPSTLSNAELCELLKAVEAIYKLFIERHPGERQNQDVRRVLAAKISQIACLMAPGERSSALRAFRRACGVNTKVSQSFALKFFALLVCGERLRSRFSR